MGPYLGFLLAEKRQSRLLRVALGLCFDQDKFAFDFGQQCPQTLAGIGVEPIGSISTWLARMGSLELFFAAEQNAGNEKRIYRKNVA